MKLNCTLKSKWLFVILTLSILLISKISFGQISMVCTSPTNTIYGLTGSGEIYPINTSTAVVGPVVKNSTYSGNSTRASNGLGYNTFNGKFYYFKRNATSTPPEFVSFDPATNTVAILANSTAVVDIHTGCVSFDGKGYYTIDVDGKLHFYNIVTNTWRIITSSIRDQYGNDVSAVIRTQNAGDMAIDGWGSIWVVTSSDANWGLYKFAAPMPVSSVASITVTRIIAPTALTPTGKSFAGIAFKPNGSIYMSTKNGNRLYLLQDAFTPLTFVGNLSVGDLGNDLTSCVFPVNVLPVMWINFSAGVQSGSLVTLDWEVAEHENKGFYIEYSKDGKDWQQLVFIPGSGQHGQPAKYTYSYSNHINGAHFYRIQQVDLSGRYSYSIVKSVEIDNAKSGIQIWPNPANTQINIQVKDLNGRANAQVFDLSGRKLIEKSLDKSTSALSINQLPKGTYILRVTDYKGQSYNEHLVKQ